MIPPSAEKAKILEKSLKYKIKKAFDSVQTMARGNEVPLFYTENLDVAHYLL
jgi:hypothetical protein